jgi:hypothetical protein
MVFCDDCLDVERTQAWGMEVDPARELRANLKVLFVTVYVEKAVVVFWKMGLNVLKRAVPPG